MFTILQRNPRKTVFLFVYFIILYLISIYSQVTEIWVVRYNKESYARDYSKSIIKDSIGNLYVVGYSEMDEKENVIVKYNEEGVKQWVIHYSGFIYNHPVKIAVDNASNVFLAGSNGDEDYVVIKYNFEGVKQWEAHYNGPSNWTDTFYDIAVDNSGNVYVTGRSYDSVTSDDYATAKFNSNGNLEWSQRYTRPGNEGDEAYSIALDTLGNVYVTGNVVTIKYNNDGTEQWSTPTGGNVIKTDDSGFIYITGSGVVTKKYNTDGIEQWSIDYSGTSLEIDDFGNVYIGNDEYAIRKYNNIGVLQWTANYSKYESHDESLAMSIDTQGNTYITGYIQTSIIYPYNYNFATVKFDTSGTELWDVMYNGEGNERDVANGMVIDNSNNVYVVGWSIISGQYPGGNTDITTIKYNSNGEQQWLSSYYSISGKDEVGNSIAVDNSGNVYVTGYAIVNFYSRYITIKYNSNGVQQWCSEYARLVDNYNQSLDIDIDDAGNVYVTGYSSYGIMYTGIATIKYSSSGNEQWVSFFEGGYSSGKAIVVDNLGDAYVTGYSGGEKMSDMTTIKYNTDGVQQWLVTYNGIGNSNDEAYDIALDNSGNVYITGYSNPTSFDLDKDFTTIKYNNAGVQQWVNKYSQSLSDVGNAIAVDNDGNVYVTGQCRNPSNFLSDYVTIKYNTNGVQQWLKTYNGTGNSEDIAADIALDQEGNVYVTGKSIGGSASAYDCVTIKYNGSGTQLWVKRYNGPSSNMDEGKKIITDLQGNVYITGKTGINTMSYYTSDYLTIMYDTNGVEQWVKIYNSFSDNADEANDIACDTWGNVYVTGKSWGGITQYDLTTIKYGLDIPGVKQEYWLIY